MRAPRLLSLLLILQTHRRMTAGELAGRLEVSVRTIYRDIEALSGAGVPVYTERGPGGGCRLLDGWQTSLTGLTAEEAQALFLSGLPGPAAELGLGAVVAAAQVKVLASLPEPLREAAALAPQRFHLDPFEWFRKEHPEHPHLATLAGAAWRDRCVSITYRRGDGKVVERRLEPLGLVLKAGLWYAVTGPARQPRVYRVSRVVEATDTGESFDRPSGFDLSAFWAGWAESFEGGLPVYPVTVRLSPVAQAHLAHFRDAARRAPTGEVVEADGWVRRQLVFEHFHHARSALLGFGDDVEVLEPTDLREAVAGALRAGARLYPEPA